MDFSELREGVPVIARKL